MSKEQWSENDEARLKRMYDFCSPCRTVREFYQKLHELVALKERSAKSVEWKCRRLKLDPKVLKEIPETCSHCKKTIHKNDSVLKDMHKTCYHAHWYQKNYKNS